MTSSDLIKNVERSMYTFNFNNIVEICFHKVVKINDKPGPLHSPQNKLSDKEKTLIDNCIDKYMQTFTIVKENSSEHLDKMFNKRE